jgi:RHS repeat-associated protein
MRDVDGLHEYYYDSLYQIVQAYHPTVTNPLEEFEYDAVGNRVGPAIVHNELNQLLEDENATYQYDADGNMTVRVEKASGDSTKYTWDIENRLVKVERPGTVVEYVYGPLGRRLAKVVNGLRNEFRYDGEDLIVEMDSQDSVIASYTFGPAIDQPMEMNRNGSDYYYLADGLGSITGITSNTGAVLQEYKYSVFGEITELTGNLENPFAYTGREWDGELGLYYYRARYYDPVVGKFLSRDPIGLAGKDINMNRYVKNSPTNLLDPDGTVSIIAIAIALRASWMAVCVQAAWDGAESYSPDDKEKHCYFSCFYNRCMLLTDPVLDFFGGVMREIVNHKEGLEDSLNDIKANIKGILQSYNFTKSCKESCRKKECKEE